MGSTIFTQTVIEQLNEFISKEVYRGVISDFDITDSHDFDKAVEDAEAGQTEFEIDDIEIMNSYDDEFYDLIAKVGNFYLIDQDCDVYTRIYISLDKEANTLEVIAKFELLVGFSVLPKSEWKVVADGDVMKAKEFESKYGRAADCDNLTCIQEFDSWIETAKSISISLEA